jgi:hypothetical protein
MTIFNVVMRKQNESQTKFNALDVKERTEDTVTNRYTISDIQEDLVQVE